MKQVTWLLLIATGGACSVGCSDDGKSSSSGGTSAGGASSNTGGSAGSGTNGSGNGNSSSTNTASTTTTTGSGGNGGSGAEGGTGSGGDGGSGGSGADGGIGGSAGEGSAGEGGVGGEENEGFDHDFTSVEEVCAAFEENQTEVGGGCMIVPADACEGAFQDRCENEFIAWHACMATTDSFPATGACLQAEDCLVWQDAYMSCIGFNRNGN